jgi:hypothetical protein
VTFPTPATDDETAKVYAKWMKEQEALRQSARGYDDAIILENTDEEPTVTVEEASAVYTTPVIHFVAPRHIRDAITAEDKMFKIACSWWA